VYTVNDADNYDVRNGEFFFAVLHTSAGIAVDTWDSNGILGENEDKAVYNGEEWVPIPVLMNTDTNEVIPADEYEVEYSNNVKAGTATITITNASNKVVQSSVLHPNRYTYTAVKMSQFTTDAANGTTVGVIDTTALAAGTYHCKITCRTVAGHELTAREFNFTVS